MSDPYLGEIKLVAFNFAPPGWALCNGQLLPINQNQALYSLLGTTWGGDGLTNFALPDLRGRAPVHIGTGFPLGQRAGTESEVLTAAQVAGHSHAVTGRSDAAGFAQPGEHLPGSGPLIYAAAFNLVGLHPGSVTEAGAAQAQAHGNVQPSLVLNFIIAVQGIFPTVN